MCRNIKTLFNFDPPATPYEVQAAAIQFVRKLSGFNQPSKANEAAFQLGFVGHPCSDEKPRARSGTRAREVRSKVRLGTYRRFGRMTGKPVLLP
jgi:hypothetical protein